MTGYVYAMSGPDGLIKIGFASNVRGRLRHLQREVGYPCEVLGYVSATPTQEYELHGLLSAYRVRGEWFRHVGAVAEFVKMLPKHSIAPFAAPRRTEMPRASRHPLTDWRLKSGLTVSKAASVLGLNQSTICRIERGCGRVTGRVARMIAAGTNGAVDLGVQS